LDPLLTPRPIFCGHPSDERLKFLRNRATTRRKASIVRLSNALLRKSKAFKTRYSALPHMGGRSYIVAISNHGTQDFNLQGDAPLQHLLFDIEKVREECLSKLILFGERSLRRAMRE
jgi:hypothetical protein